MAWTYNGLKNSFVNLNVLGATTTGSLKVNGQSVIDGNEFVGGNMNVTGSQFNQNDIWLENEKWLKTKLPAVPPGPQGNRLTPNIQFQPRTLNGAVSTTGQSAMAAVVLPNGMVSIKGTLITTQAARTNGTILWDLNNTNLEKRLWPAYEHHWWMDGLGNGSGFAPTLVLFPNGTAVAYNLASATTGNLNYAFSGVWTPGPANSANGVEFQGYFYGNGGY